MTTTHMTTRLPGAALLALLAAPALAQSPWGPEDEIGAMNRVTPESVLEAVQLVTEGRVYSLGMTVDGATPAFRHRYFHIETTQPANGPEGENDFTFIDDQLIGWTGVGSQLNGLAHYGRDYTHYNGHRTEDILSITGVAMLGTEKIPPAVARGVLLDMRPHYNLNVIEAGTAFNRTEIDAVAEAQGVEIREGDVVLFCTGWMDLMGEENQRYLQGSPGLGVEGAAYLAETGVILAGADSWSLDVLPHEDPTLSFPVHQSLAVDHGIQVLENMRCDELAEDEAWEFLFVMGQPKYRGTTQVQINPVAIR